VETRAIVPIRRTARARAAKARDVIE